VVRSFQLLQKLGDFVAVPDSQREGRHDKRLGDSFLLRVHQAEVEQTIDRPLEGVARAPLLLLDEHGNVVVDGESLPHIMMLTLKAS
jgi:hypothetical protein